MFETSIWRSQFIFSVSFDFCLLSSERAGRSRNLKPNRVVNASQPLERFGSAPYCYGSVSGG